ncbi:S-adenosyl-L-methionine-dependent methyltransferase [Aspergillus karnatakaensis]|uniref:methyltransferase tpcM n=1 Tax=Aspergillus karnatakaensis TaxID=1810916 RepID=UPI003CCDB29A
MALQSSHTDPNQKALGFQGQGFDWAQYVKYRPVYPASFYSRLYSYHRSSSELNTFNTAHDVGAGAGIVSEHLARQFKNVIVSEPNNDFLAIAKSRLALLFPGKENAAALTFHAERAENSSVMSATVELITISEALHWTDIPATIAEFSRQLKPHGTLCIVHYGPIWILDNVAAQTAWEGLFSDVVRKLFSRPGESMEVYRRSTRVMATGFDNVVFPASDWREGVKRIFTNTGGDRKKLGFARECEEEEDAVGVAEGQDQRVFVEDDEDWIVRDCDLTWLQSTFTSYVPGKKVEDDLARWEEMERALGGKTVTVAWPSVVILATKR